MLKTENLKNAYIENVDRVLIFMTWNYFQYFTGYIIKM